MIDIERLYLIVNNDLARKDHAGYTATDEFNRTVNLIQQSLFDFYIEKNDARAKEPLRPFIFETFISKTSVSYYDLPSDYRQKLELGFDYLTSDCGTYSHNVKSADYLDYNEVLLNNESDIRLNEPSYSFVGTQVKTTPTSFLGQIYLKYYRNPVDAVRAFTLNVSTQEEEYNAGSSTHLEWEVMEIPNFVDLMLMYKGIAVRSTELTQWVMAKGQFEIKTAVNND